MTDWGSPIAKPSSVTAKDNFHPAVSSFTDALAVSSGKESSRSRGCPA